LGYDSPSPRPRLRPWLPSPKLGRGAGGEGKIYANTVRLRQNHFYRELSRLEEKEWLQAESVQQEHRPDKRIYSVTELGKQQLCHWIAEAEEMTPIKDDLLVKLYVGHLVPKTVIVAKQEHRRQHQQRLTIYT
jgi:DNA-binding PadR family transcriptional regulator